MLISALTLFGCTVQSPATADTAEAHGVDSAGAGLVDTVGDSGARDTASSADTGGGGPETGQSGFFGSPPTSVVELPEFEVTNQYGFVRTRDDLLGHPTLLWFVQDPEADC